MGICTSSEERAGKNKSQSIDRMIEKDGQKLKRECKILLLGSGESGKTTTIKQMKVLHQNGFTKNELFAWRTTIYKNVMESALALIHAIEKFEYQYEDDKNNYYANYIASYQLSEHNQPAMDTNIIDAIISVWKDGVIVELMNREGSDFYLMDSACYFFEHIKRIGHPDYVPNVQDVLRARSKTTGITESHFNMGQLQIHMFDVGGQRSERKKWIHCFEAVTSIIFCVSLSEYDQVLLEESRQNRLMESLVLFESVINSRWFLNTSIILFLNKIDIFKVKLPKVPLEKYFPDYGGGNDVNKAAKYILWRFSQTNRAKLRIYPHLTEATDTANIKVVFAAIKRTILNNALKDSGIL
ncbi:unnamed protein product [Absidia cylindrospora]